MPAEQPGAVESRLADGMVMAYVPEGEFSMGSSSGGANEQPLHTVYLDAFWIDSTEVTNAMFTLFIEATGYQTDAEGQGGAWIYDGAGWSETPGADWQHPRGPGSDLTGLEDHPVVNVSWNDAAAYCAWAGVRLPTEGEWEKAARGLDDRTYPWGDQSPAGDLLNFADINLNVDWASASVDDGYQFTAPVGSYPAGASPYGALDMAGNVWEWVNDWYSPTYYAVSPASNPAGPATGTSRVLRGGSWNHDGANLHSSLRLWNDPAAAIDNFGFRCAQSVP
ncbi:MAG TPA: formylglycine-generating enzyme family protein [Anaerolineaceae bacterium]|nr:formylglycine-generating enzyme family protein [Anaerolineaceae bacterium]